MKRNYLWLIALCCWCLTSCIKDEALGKECDIKSAWVEGEEYEQYFYQTSEMKNEVGSAETSITFAVRSMLSLSKQIPLQLKITDGATVSPASGSVQDFTKGPVTYTVTSQDGQWQRHYTVIFREASLPAEVFSFENVETQTERTLLGGTKEMHVFYEQVSSAEEETKKYCWGTGNPGAALLVTGSKPENFPTYSVSDGYVGKGVCLNTQSAGALGLMLDKPIATGSLFLGKFIVDYVLSDVLKSTLFGVPNSKMPVRITGWYKFKPGEQFTDRSMKVIEGRVDEPCIYAVFYRNTDDNGNSYVLDGHAVEYFDKLLDNPQVYKVAEVKSLPPTDTWTQWEMFFEGRDAPEDILSNMGCNLAMVISSSKLGVQFQGAVGSTLYVDEVEVFYEK
jgi:hypothetical protein